MTDKTPRHETKDAYYREGFKDDPEKLKLYEFLLDEMKHLRTTTQYKDWALVYAIGSDHPREVLGAALEVVRLRILGEEGSA